MGRYTHPKVQWIDSNGDPLTGGKLYFYATGTTTPQDTYTTEALSVANANPVVADSTGTWGDIWLGVLDYKVVLKDQNDVQIWSADPLNTIGVFLGTSTYTTGIEFTIDGGGVAVTTGVKRDLVIPFACTITGHHSLGDQSGSFVLDIWKKAFVANTVPTVANTITAAAKPTVAGALNASSTTLTGWTTAISANDHLRINVDSCTTTTRITLVLAVTRTISVTAA
jgi:hypothetical protein